MPTPARPSPRIQAERLEQREVFSAGLDPTFGTGGILDDPGYYGPGVADPHTDLFVTASGQIRVGSIDTMFTDSVEVVPVDPNGTSKSAVIRAYIRDESLADFTVLPDDPQTIADTLAGLRRAAGFLRGQIGRRVRIHTTPELRFVHDQSTARGMEMSKLIDDAVSRRADDPSAED